MRDPVAPNTVVLTAVRGAESCVLFEGLPHQLFERDLLEEERRTKAVQEIGGYPFYREPLPLSEREAQRLSRILGEPRIYEPHVAGKRCGGFHPDYAVEWQAGSEVYRALICFGCGEIKLLGPGFESLFDMGDSEELSQLLMGRRKNRPVDTGAAPSTL